MGDTRRSYEGDLKSLEASEGSDLERFDDSQSNGGDLISDDNIGTNEETP